MMVKVSNDCVDIVKHFEGFRAHVYLCPAGKPTIGYGHLVKPTEKFNGPITEEFAETLLLNDLVKHISKKIHDGTPQHMVDALTSFSFNFGVAALEGSTLFKHFLRKDFVAASKAFKFWCNVKVNGVAQRNDGLLRRRLAEAEMFSGRSWKKYNNLSAFIKDKGAIDWRDK